MSLAKIADTAVIAMLSQLLQELESGQITVVEHALKDDEVLVFSAAFARHASVEDEEAAAQVRAGKRCPKCSCVEVTTAGGMDRLCVQCQHVWRPGG